MHEPLVKSAVSRSLELSKIPGASSIGQPSNNKKTLSQIPCVDSPNSEEIENNGKLSYGTRAVLIEAISDLPRMQAKLVVLHYLRDMPLSEVGIALELAPNEVDILHREALRRLKKSSK